MLTVNVTQDHIDKGVRKEAYHCPVSLALGEADPGSDWCVSTLLVMRENGHDVVSIFPPVTVSKFVSRFDNGDPVQPFTFEIDLDHEPDGGSEETPYRSGGAHEDYMAAWRQKVELNR